MKKRSNDALISLLVPVYNEEASIGLLYRQILENISDFKNYELIFVDDGSSDETLAVIKELREKNDRIHFLALSKNFGHQNALKAALDVCKGDLVISLDGDLQHPPSLLPKMIDAWKNDYDVVVTRREDSKALGTFKKLTSRYFYTLLSRMSDLDIKPGTADFRLLDRKVVDALKRFDERDIFYRGFVAWVGFKQVEISYAPKERIAGETKYTLKKMTQLASRGLFGFSILPLRMVTLIGMFIAFFSFLYGFYAILMRLFGDGVVSGWASVMAGIYFLGGIQLFCIGICGEYIGRVFLQIKQRPHYIVAETSLSE